MTQDALNLNRVKIDHCGKDMNFIVDIKDTMKYMKIKRLISGCGSALCI